MLKDIIPLIVIIASIIIVFLNYWKEIRTKKESEIYLKKLSFYEELIDYLNSVLKQEDKSYGAQLAKLYNKSFIFSSDEVIFSLNRYMDIITRKKIIPVIEVKPIIANILIACRKDLGIKTAIIIDSHYKVPFS